MDALLASAPLLLAQHVLLHLPCRGLGQVTKLYGIWALEVRQALAAEGDDLLFGYPLPWLQGDECLGTFAPRLVRYGNDSTLQDSSMLDDDLLHLNGRNVLATRDDHILLAIAQFNVAIRVPHGEVTGVEPASFKCCGSRVRVLVVAFHHVIAAHHDLTH